MEAGRELHRESGAECGPSADLLAVRLREWESGSAWVGCWGTVSVSQDNRWVLLHSEAKGKARVIRLPPLGSSDSCRTLLDIEAAQLCCWTLVETEETDGKLSSEKSVPAVAVYGTDGLRLFLCGPTLYEISGAEDWTLSLHTCTMSDCSDNAGPRWRREEPSNSSDCECCVLLVGRDALHQALHGASPQGDFGETCYLASGRELVIAGALSAVSLHCSCKTVGMSGSVSARAIDSAKKTLWTTAGGFLVCLQSASSFVEVIDLERKRTAAVIDLGSAVGEGDLNRRTLQLSLSSDLQKLFLLCDDTLLALDLEVYFSTHSPFPSDWAYKGGPQSRRAGEVPKEGKRLVSASAFVQTTARREQTDRLKRRYPRGVPRTPSSWVERYTKYCTSLEDGVTHYSDWSGPMSVAGQCSMPGSRPARMSGFMLKSRQNTGVKPCHPATSWKLDALFSHSGEMKRIIVEPTSSLYCCLLQGESAVVIDTSSTDTVSNGSLAPADMALTVVNGSLLTVRPSGLGALLRRQESANETLSVLTKFGHHAMACDLAALNDWSLASMRLRALQTGLAYRQFSVVSASVEDLEEHQMWPGLLLMTTFLVEQWNVEGARAVNDFYLEVLSMASALARNCLFAKIQAHVGGGSGHTPSSNLNLPAAGLVACQQLLESLSPPSSPAEAIDCFGQALHLLRLLKEEAGAVVHSKKGKRERRVTLSGSQGTLLAPVVSAGCSDDRAVVSLSAAMAEEGMEHWQGMTDLQVVREGLQSNKLSLAYCLVLWRAMRRREEGSYDEDRLPSMEDIMTAGFCCVYQCLTTGDMVMADKMLSCVGETRVEVLLEVLLHTKRKALRKRLLEFLSSRGTVIENYPEILEGIQFLAALEERYSNPYFALEGLKQQALEAKVAEEGDSSNLALSALTSLSTPTADAETLGVPLRSLACEELEDMTAEVEARYGFLLQRVTGPSAGKASPHDGQEARLGAARLGQDRVQLQPPTASSYHGSDGATGGYAHFSLAWALQWDEETRCRLLLPEEFTDAIRWAKGTWLRCQALLHRELQRQEYGQAIASAALLQPKEEHLTGSIDGNLLPLSRICGGAYDRTANLISRTPLSVQREILGLLCGNGLVFFGLIDVPDPLDVSALEAGGLLMPRTQLGHSLGGWRRELPQETLSSTHVRILRALLSQESFEAVREYLVAYSLYNIDRVTLLEELEPSLPTSRHRTWFATLLSFLRRDRMSQLALLNGELLLRTAGRAVGEGEVRLADLVSEHWTLAALGTLVFQLQEERKNIADFAGGTGKSTYEGLCALLKASYPAAFQLLANVVTRGSVTGPDVDGDEQEVSFLIGRVVEAFEGSYYLNFPSGDSDGILAFSTGGSTRGQERTDVRYYLQQGLPLAAYEQQQEGPLEKEELEETVYSLLLTHANDNAVMSASSFFLHLVGIDSWRFRCTASLVRRILAHQDDASREMISQVLREPSPAAVEAFLDAAEDATTSLDEEWFRDNDFDVMQAFNGDAAPCERRTLTKWTALAYFGTLFGTGWGSRLISRLAGDQYWPAFLYEAGLGNCTRGDVALAASRLDSHLGSSLHIQGLFGSRLPFDSDLTSEKGQRSALQLVYQARLAVPSASVLLSLLSEAVARREPLLALAAGGLNLDTEGSGDSSSRALCFVAWAVSSLPAIDNEEEMPWVASAESVISDGNGLTKSAKDRALRSTVVGLCRSDKSLIALRGISLFYGRCPLFALVQFYRSVLHARYEEARKHFGSFLSALSDPEDDGDHSMECLHDLAEDLLQVLLEKRPDPFPAGRLLEILAERDFGERWTQQHHLSRFSRMLGIPCELGTSPEEFLQVLIHQAKYDDAKELCRAVGLDTDTVVLYQLSVLLKTSEQGHTWGDIEERIRFWDQTQATLQEEQCTPAVAGEFMYALSQKYSTSGREYACLVQHTLHWFQSLLHSSPEAFAGTGRDEAFLAKLTQRADVLTSGLAKGADLELPPDAWHEETVNESLVERLTEALLEHGHVQKAKELCERFSHSNGHLEVLLEAEAFAHGRLDTPKELSPRIRGLLEEKLSTRYLYSVASRKEVLLALLSFSGPGRAYYEELLAIWTAADALGITYGAALRQDPYQILRYLILLGSSSAPICKDFISARRLDQGRIAVMMADMFFKAIHFTDFHEDDEQQQRSAPKGLRASRYQAIDGNMSALDFEAFLSVTTEPQAVGDRMLEIIHSAGLPSSVVSDSESDISDSEGGGGRRWASKKGELPAQVEVELCVRAHHCYTVASYHAGVEAILRYVRLRVPPLAAAGEHRLLVRFLTGTRKYVELQEIFSVLVKNEAFELLLRRQGLDTTVDKVELQFALSRYLQQSGGSQGTDSRKLELVFLAFKMWRQMANTLFDAATEGMQALDLNAGEKKLTRSVAVVTRAFLDAGDNFAKAKCYRLAKRCSCLAGLLVLQLECPQVGLLNLSLQDARRIMTMMASFSDALILARAYELDTYDCWVAALYRQVVHNRNQRYWQAFAAEKSFGPSLWIDLGKRFISDPQLAQHAGGFKFLLEQLEDTFLLRKLATELGFSAVCDKYKGIAPELYQDWLARHQQPMLT